MFVFSVNAKAREPKEGVEVGEQVPFIVYINFQDMFGAEQLCKIYLMHSGFTEIDIENRKMIAPKLLKDKRVVQADKAMKEALDSGYMIQMFEA